MKKLVAAFSVAVLTAGSALAADRVQRLDTHLEGFNLDGLPVATSATGEARIEVIDGAPR